MVELTELSGGIGWSGAACPVCGPELDAEAPTTGNRISAAYCCRVRGTVSVGDPFQAEH